MTATTLSRGRPQARRRLSSSSASTPKAEELLLKCDLLQ